MTSSLNHSCGTFELLLLAQELLLVEPQLSLHCIQKIGQLVLVRGKPVDDFLRVENVHVFSIAFVEVVLVVFFLPVRGLLLFSEALAGPAMIRVIVVLEIGLLDVVALEDGLALLGAEVVALLGFAHAAKIIK